MLILSRKLGEKIIIGDGEVEMVVISYDKGQVKLGFEADKKIKINREEVHIKIENERKQAEMQKQIEIQPGTEAETITASEEAVEIITTAVITNNPDLARNADAANDSDLVDEDEKK